MANIGEYNKKIKFLKLEKVKNEYREYEENWTVYKTIWAKRTPLLGNQLFTAMTTDTKIEVKFNSRYTSGIDSNMRIQCGSDIYEILSVIDVDDKQVELLCYCRLVKQDV